MGGATAALDEVGQPGGMGIVAVIALPMIFQVALFAVSFGRLIVLLGIPVDLLNSHLSAWRARAQPHSAKWPSRDRMCRTGRAGAIRRRHSARGATPSRRGLPLRTAAAAIGGSDA
jgi:hypothetical protein